MPSGKLTIQGYEEEQKFLAELQEKFRKKHEIRGRRDRLRHRFGMFNFWSFW